MKTKSAKILKFPDREPTESELRAIEESNAAVVEIEAADEAGDEAVTGDGDAPKDPQTEWNAVASTSIDLARLGLNQIAYLRRTVVDDAPVWSIYSATGHPLGAATTLEQAWGAIVQNDLQPVFVH